MKLEMISRHPAEEAHPVPLLFVHGAFADAAVWDVHFLPHFADCGYRSHAFSLRGHGFSEGREQLPWHSLADYVADLERVVSCFDRPPVLIGHSMGGMIIQKFLEKNDATGVVLMASTPPHGLLASIVGMGVSNPLLLWQLALIQQLGPGYGQPAILHQALFSKNTPMHSVIDYAHLFGGESVRVSLDMLGLNPLNPAKKPNVPMLVLGAEHDAFFSTGIVHDTARTYGVEATTFSDMGHAMMLEREWRTVADRILDWLTGCLATTAQPEPAISG